MGSWATRCARAAAREFHRGCRDVCGKTCAELGHDPATFARLRRAVKAWPARGGVGLSGEGGRVVALRQRRRCVLGSLRTEGSELGEPPSPSAVDSNAELRDTAAERRRVDAARLQKMAEEAAAAARDADKRAQSVKTGPMQQLAALSQKVKKDSERGRLQKEAQARAAEAARLAALADEAETTRGTATLANNLAEKARIEIRLADDAERPRFVGGANRRSLGPRGPRSILRGSGRRAAARRS